VSTTSISPGGQVVLPPGLVRHLRLRDGRPATLLQAEAREEGVFLRPVEPRDLPAETLRQWITDGNEAMDAFRKARG